MKFINEFLFTVLIWLVSMVSYGGMYLTSPTLPTFDFVSVCGKLWSYVTPFAVGHRVDRWQWFRSTIRMYTLKVETLIKLSIGTASALSIHYKRYHLLLKVGWTMAPLHIDESVLRGPGLAFA